MLTWWGDIGSNARTSDTSVIGDVVGFSAIPGSDRVYNHNKGAWENTYNEAPNNAYLGWGVYVTTGSKVIVRKGKPHGQLQPILEEKIFLSGPQPIHQVFNHIETLTLTMMSGKLLVMIAPSWKIIWDLILIHIIIQIHLMNHVYRVYFSTTQLLRTNWPKGLLANMVRPKRRLTQSLSRGKRLLTKLEEIVRLPFIKHQWVCDYS